MGEAVTITLRDHVPFFRSRPGVTAGMTCGAAFLLGLVMCTEGGEAVMDIMDHYTANYCVLLIGLFECLSVWAYEYNGAAVGWTKDKQKSWRDVVFSSRLEQEMLKITGQSLKWLPFYWSFLVKFIAPVLITTLFAINLLPAGVSHFFAVFFFLFLLFLGIDSSMALAEAVTITLRDHVPFFRSRPGVTAGMTCGAAFLLGLVMCTEGGEAVMDIMDHYTANYCVLLIGLFECLSVWAYEYNGAAVGWTKDKQKSWRDVVFSSRLEQEMLKITGQ